MLWTLDHWNDAMYPATQNLPTVDAWRQAYANFAAAAVDNFQGRNCLYEIWNEPDQLPSWPGGASNGNMSQRATQYTALVQQAVPAMRQADPTCTIMGASLSSISYTDFIRPCLDQGLLDYVDAVSVHPYRNTNPETAMPDYNTLSNLINAYGPTKPVVVSEWGYSSSVEDQFSAGSAQSQGDYMARAFLINLSRSISLTSFYDWGMNDSETGFGIVTAEGGAKPAYDELRLLTQSLYGETFRYRLSTANPNDWLLVFQTPGGHQTLAAWTTGSAHSTNVTGWGPLYLTGTPFYVNPSPIPEPDALLLLTIGLVGFLAYGRRHSRKTGEIAITGVVGRHACLPQSRGRHNLA
jgi:arabinogalactan endo-1,4-beta-galactosidase